MLLLSHILIAFAGLALGTYSYFKLSRQALRATYVLSAGTLTTGIWLLVREPSHIMSACAVGLLYFAILGAITYIARQRIATARSLT